MALTGNTDKVGRVVAADDDNIRRMSINDANIADLARDATAAATAEHSMTLLQGIKTYPYAVGWSAILSAAIIMEGFDKILINNLYANEPFQRTFGEQQPNGSYEVTAAWQSGISNAAICGEIIGLLINGIAAERYGYKKTIITSLFMVTCFIFIVFFSHSPVTLVVGQVLLGIPWGVFQTICVTYASEVCPTSLRAYLTTWVNACWVIGQLIASGVLRGVVSRTDSWGYRIPFALQWIWPIPIAIAVAFAPESPWWLVRHERREDAKKALLRLTSRVELESGAFNPDETIAMMEYTNTMEKSRSAGTSYLDCFKGSNLRRTEIVCCTWLVQTLCGASLMGYSTYFYTQAGLSREHAFTMSMAQFALGLVGTLFSWALMSRFGRRTLYISGECILCALLLVAGGLGIISRSNTGAQWAIGTMLLLFTFFYDITVGPVCYSLVSELSSSRLRAKSVVLARAAYNVASIIINVLMPYMLNPSAWNWGAKSGFFWASTCAICIVWTYFRLPEPKGRTYGELDILFEQGVPARKFKTTAVDLFAASSDGADSITNEKMQDKQAVERVEHA